MNHKTNEILDCLYKDKNIMKEHGLLFQAQMVQGIKTDRKQHTRRPVTAHNSICVPHVKKKNWNKLRFQEAWSDGGPSPAGNQGPYLHVPYGDIVVRVYPRYTVGDNIWVRETWAAATSADGPIICYRSDSHRRYLMHESNLLLEDGSLNYDLPHIKKLDFCQWAADLESGVEGQWKSSIRMYRWISRFIMPITKLQVDRIQNINGMDCVKEGIMPVSLYDLKKQSSRIQADYFSKAVSRFKRLWNNINEERGYSWKRNHWVWVIEWERVIR